MTATKTFSAWALKNTARGEKLGWLAPYHPGVALWATRKAARQAAGRCQRPVRVLVEVREIPA